MMTDLESVEIVYVGEQHTSKEDHAIQLKIMTQLSAADPDLAVGMEMFAHTYQPILTKWSSQAYSEQTFLEKTHWHANWQFDFALYEDLLEFIKQRRLPLIGLNVPFDIPPKIAVGGIANLLPYEKPFLPETIDTTNAAHREFVSSVLKKHHQPGLTNFEYFYEAQCVWEDAMAEAIVQNRNDRSMIVFAGSGHLQHKYGIPLRVYKRQPSEFRTVIPMPAGQTVAATLADYIWVTSTPDGSLSPMPTGD
jgi:uncharacterized iron-regulated protein